MSDQGHTMDGLAEQVESLTRKWNMTRAALKRSHEQRDVARHRVKELEALLKEALGWIRKPPRKYSPHDFIKRAASAVGEE